MLRLSSQGASSRVRIGFPSRDGEFNGIVAESSLSIGGIIVGGAIAVAIVWLVTRAKRAQAVEAVDAPTHLSVARATT